MRKPILILLILLIITSACFMGCNPHNEESIINVSDTYLFPYENSTAFSLKETFTIPKVEEEVKTNISESETRNFDGTIQDDYVPVDIKVKRDDISRLKYEENYILYYNNEYEFCLEIPSYWENNFMILKSKEKDVWNFVFFGSSKIGQGYIFDKKYEDGLLMFSIFTEDVYSDLKVVDKVKVIGSIYDVSYYYGNSTDYSLGSLREELDDCNNGNSIYQDNEAEIRLIKQDIELSEKMENDIENIVNSFKLFKDK